MAFVFGFMCNQPSRSNEALSPARRSLLTAGPVSRWGLGYVQGEVLLRTLPVRYEQGVDFFSEMDGLHADYIVGQACGEDGLSGAENTPPFRFRRWLYGAIGESKGFEDIRAQLETEIPSFLHRNIGGHTIAKYLFNLFLAQLHADGSIDNPNLDPGYTTRILREAYQTVRNALPKTASLAINQLITNSRSMVALRCGSPMFFRRLKISSPEQVKVFKGVLVISGIETPGPGFEEIPLESALMIFRDLRTEITPLPPR